MINQLSGSCYEWVGGSFDVNFIDYSTTAEKVYNPLRAVPSAHSFRSPDYPEVSTSRFPRGQLAPMKKVIDSILAGYGRYDLCGSYRRGKPTVKDLDYVVECSREDFALLRDELNNTGVKIHRGANEIMNGSLDGIPCDFFRADPESYTSILIWRTGSAKHNIYCARVARRRGMKVKRAGIQKRNGEMLHPATEHEFYKILGVPYMRPNERDMDK